ncbi:MAG: hypothetical protein KJ990_04475 [Proteobacteria bacterium]|nr:hypothetical protein [Pseudomonadota bacterium]MBU1649954.1 hypothetical protein [Pseudomonadota bacterium]
MGNEKSDFDAIVINEAQLILAEKRTSLAVMRTGIAVLVLPLSILSLLVVTSRYYDVMHVLQFIIPVAIINFLLIVFGAYLVVHSFIRMRHHDRLIQEIKVKYSVIGEFID